MDIVQFVFNLLVFVLNTIIWLFASVLNIIFSLLPNSPFLDLSTTYDLTVNKYIDNICLIGKSQAKYPIYLLTVKS